MPESNPAGSELLDARGVPIHPGDTAIYGFGVGRSIAMAEAVVLGAHADHKACQPPCLDEVSLTPSGRVRLRVVRRSYSLSLTHKPIVDVAPDRLVVLKATYVGVHDDDLITLPPSPLPTQAEEARANIEGSMAYHTEILRTTTVAPAHWARNAEAGDPDGLALAEYLAWHAAQLKEDRRKLKALDDD